MTKLTIRVVSAAIWLGLSATSFAQATSLPSIAVTSTDRVAVSARTREFVSSTPLGTLGQTGSKVRSDSPTLLGASLRSDHGGAGRGAQFPGDLSYLGGATIPQAVSHVLYPVSSAGNSCFASGLTRANAIACWGDVAQLLTDLGGSDFIHITDQYVGAHGGGRYSVDPAAHAVLYPAVTPTPTNPQGALTNQDVASFAYAAAKRLGAGYGHVYHILLPPEQGVCFDSTYQTCSYNSFCAYHGSVTTDIGEVVYTVEPNVVNTLGCNAPAGSPNGSYDATYSVLSHEFFETVTDPDGASWWNVTDSAILGSEIGDECLFWIFDASGAFVSTNPVVQNLNGHPYAVQTEYNNQAHACTTHPGALAR